MHRNSGRKSGSSSSSSHQASVRIAPVATSKGAIVYERIRKPVLLDKWLDTNWYTTSTVTGVSLGNTSTIPNNGQHYNICAIAEGSDRVHRVGRSLKLKGFEMRAVVEAGKENLLFAGDINNIVRFMLWRPRSTDPITSSTTITNNLFPVGDPITAIPDADDVAEIYFDKTVAVRSTYGPNSTGSGTATITQWQALVHESVKMNVPVMYTNTGAANVGDGQVILSVWSDSSATPYPSASCSFRVLFEDDV
jgi:hypothetical protein